MRLSTQKNFRTRLRLLGTLALLALAPAVEAQVSAYSFTQSSGSYTPITGGTVIGQATNALPTAVVESEPLDDYTFTGVSIPFTFTFNGVPYTSLNINTNGWVSFAGSTTSVTTPLSTAAVVDAISPFGRDLVGVFSTSGTRTSGSNTITAVVSTANCYVGAPIQGAGIPAGTTVTAFTANTITMSAAATASSTATYLSYATGEIRVETVGTAPNRTFVVQFKGFSQYATSVSTTTNNTGCEFQVRLNEGGGVSTAQSISIVYGNLFRAGGSQTGQVGLKSTATDFNNRVTTTDWSATTAGTANNNTTTWSVTATPAAGQTYTWVPPSCLGPTAAATTPITATGATLNWVAPSPAPTGGYQYYYSTSSTTPLNTATPSGATAAGTTTAATGILLPATTYFAWVRSVCAVGNESNWISLGSFTTLCNVFTVPFTEGFNSGALPNCWTNSNVSNSTSATAFWKFSGTPDYGANPNGRPTGSYAWVDASSPYVDSVMLLSPSINLTGLAAPYVKFDWFKNNTDAAANHLNNPLTVQVNAGAGWQNIFSDTSNSPSWRTEGVSLGASYVNATVQLRFVVNKSTSNNFYDDLLLDSLQVIDAPTCFAPTGLMVSSTTATGAQISWTAPTPVPAGYEWEVRTSGAPGSGATGLAASGTAASAATTATITGLVAGTAYSLYIRANCGSANSSWTSPTVFATTLDCTTATTIVCGVPTTVTIPAGNGAYSNNACNFSTPGIEKLFSFTPSVTGTYTLSTTSATGGYVDYMFKPAAGGCGPTGWTCIDDVNGAVNNSVTMTAGTTYLFLLDPENTTGVSQTFVMQCCFTPTALTAAVTQTSASLGWSQAGTPSLWQVEWGNPTFTLGTGTSAFSGTNPYALGGLTAATSFSYFVRAICGAGDTSAWSPRYLFTTACVSATLPFAENFATAYPTSNCWSEATGDLNAASVLTGSSSVWTSDTWLNVSGNNAAKINIYNNTFTSIRDWMITPTIDFGAGGLKVLEFNMGIVHWNTTTPDTLGSDDTLAVVISPDNGVTWSTANAVKVFTAANAPSGANGAERYYIPLNGYSGLVKIGFYGSQGNVADTKDNDVMIDSILVTNCNIPVVNLGNDTVLCPNKTISLTGGAGTEYLWSTGATTQSIAAATAGTYWVKTINGSLGCYNSDTVVIAAGVNPVVNLGNDTTLCPGVTKVLDAGNAGSTYSWNNATTGQTLTAAAAGTYFVTVTNATACKSADTIVIANGIVPNVSLGNDTDLCANVVLTLDGGIGSSFAWSTGDTTQTVSVNMAGTYSVIVTSSTACTATDTIVVTTTALPTVNTITPAITGASVSFTSDAANQMGQAWDFGDGTTDTAASPTHSYAANGVYTVRIIAANRCGADTAITTVEIKGLGIGHTANPNSISVYPNPAVTNMTIEGKGVKMESFSLFNNVGALVKQAGSINNSKEMIDISTLPAGMYLLRVQTSIGVVSHKVQITK